MQPGIGGGQRPILAADPAVVAEVVHQAEQERIVDLAGAGLVAPRVIRELHVGNELDIFFDGRGEIAFHDLHVIDVVLQKQVVRTHLANDVQRLL